MSLPYPEINRERGPSVGWFVHDGVKHYVHGDHLSIRGGYPQLDSDEWIEYIPKPKPRIVERDGALYWMAYDDSFDGSWLYVQITRDE